MPSSRLRTSKQSSPATEATRPTSQGGNKPPARTEYLTIKSELHKRLLDEIDDIELGGETDATVATAVRAFVDRVLDQEELPINEPSVVRWPRICCKKRWAWARSRR